MNAVFFGIKQEQGVETEAGCGSKDVGPCSSIGTVSVTLPTRKHVLQVSTYQVKFQLSLKYHEMECNEMLFLDVRFDVIQCS